MLLMAKRAMAPLPMKTLLVQSLPCHRSKDHRLDKGNLSLRDCFYPSLDIQWPLHYSGHLRALSLKRKVGRCDLSGSVLCQARRCPLSTSEWEPNKSQEQKRISPQNGLPYGWKRLIFTLLLKILKAQDARVKGEDGSRKRFCLGRSLNEVKRWEWELQDNTKDSNPLWIDCPRGHGGLYWDIFRHNYYFIHKMGVILFSPHNPNFRQWDAVDHGILVMEGGHDRALGLGWEIFFLKGLDTVHRCSKK